MRLRSAFSATVVALGIVAGCGSGYLWGAGGAQATEPARLAEPAKEYGW